MSTVIEPFALLDFVSHDETRAVLLKPLRFGDYIYATDGRVMVRTNAALFPEVAAVDDARLQAKMEELLAGTLPDTDWCQPTTDMQDVKPMPCDNCVDGVDTCMHCDHEGPCGNCDGTGFTVPSEGIMVGRVKLNKVYVNKICRLPGVMLHMPPTADPMSPVRFRFDHGIGVLMPMKTE